MRDWNCNVEVAVKYRCCPKRQGIHEGMEMSEKRSTLFEDNSLFGNAPLSGIWVSHNREGTGMVIASGVIKRD
jgi:hypothetical protein